jgi:ribonuclease HII
VLLYLGIDEAGRGCLVGDMFVAAVALYDDVVELLANAGVKDSKKLSQNSRSKLFKVILSNASFIYVRRYQPDVIDSVNLNDLFLDAIKMSIKTVYKLGFKPTTIYIDSTSNMKKIVNSLSGIVYHGTNLIVEYNADEKYIPVSAASIVAKVLRDRHIEYLKTLYGDFGSGYPSDPKTVKWIRDIVLTRSEVPPIVRKSWKTIKKIYSSVKTLDEYI